MSYEAMHQVRASGLTDRTQVDVLEALAFFHNKETGACFPSTESIARISRVNDRLVRTTLKALHEAGYVSSEQKPGQKRYFTLHLDRLPSSEPLQESTALKESTPLHKSTGEGCRKVQWTPVEKCSTPLYETTAEQGINKISNKEKEQGSNDAVPATADVKEKHSSERGSRLTLTELPSDWKAFADKEDSELDPYRLFDNFHDYWTGLSGSRAIKKDWSATWRNFVRSFKNSPDWKRRPMLKPEAASREQYKSKFTVRETPQSERVYGL